MGERQGLTVSAAASINGPLESPANFTQRIVAWWDSLIAHIESLGPRQDPYYFLVVVHGGFLSGLLADLVESGKVEREEDVLLGIHRCFNCSISLVDIAETGVSKLVKFGDIKHLDQEQLAMDVVKINVDEMVVVGDK
jgi:2,3-bisphosphoglycerate-dependent phosphoglycerate mutase